MIKIFTKSVELFPQGFRGHYYIVFYIWVSERPFDRGAERHRYHAEIVDRSESQWNPKKYLRMDDTRSRLIERIIKEVHLMFGDIICEDDFNEII